MAQIPIHASATLRIIRRDSPGGAAKLRTRGKVRYPGLPCYFLLKMY